METRVSEANDGELGASSAARDSTEDSFDAFCHAGLADAAVVVPFEGAATVEGAAFAVDRVAAADFGFAVPRDAAVVLVAAFVALALRAGKVAFFAADFDEAFFAAALGAEALGPRGFATFAVAFFGEVPVALGVPSLEGRVRVGVAERGGGVLAVVAGEVLVARPAEGVFAATPFAAAFLAAAFFVGALGSGGRVRGPAVRPRSVVFAMGVPFDAGAFAALDLVAAFVAVVRGDGLAAPVRLGVAFDAAFDGSRDVVVEEARGMAVEGAREDFGRSAMGRT